MSQPAEAFKQGGIASRAMASLPGLGGVSVPGFTSSSSSGDIGQTFGFDSSGMSVNYGTSANNSGWMLAAALLVGVLLLWKKRST